MSNFEELKGSIKNRWLDYYQVNRSWIKLLMERNSGYETVDTSDTDNEAKRPNSYLIVGIISALDPQIANLMPPFCQLDDDADKLVEVLGLNFDPDLELEKRANEASNIQNSQTDPYLEEIRKQNQN